MLNALMCELDILWKHLYFDANQIKVFVRANLKVRLRFAEIECVAS